MIVPVVIVGAGGHAKVVCDALLAGGLPESELLGFVDRDEMKWGSAVLGFPVLGSLESLGKTEGVNLVMGIGDNAAREREFNRARSLGYRIGSIVHPSAVIGRGCQIGGGVVVFAHAVVNACAEVGDDVILNTACSVDHDCRIGAHAHIAPGARLAGDVSVGAGTLVGIGAAVMPGVLIGAKAVVGAGAVVTRDLADCCVAVGVPARVIKMKGE